MSSKRNPRTRKDPFFARMLALGRGRFRDLVQGITYVDSRDMDDYFDEAEAEWQRRRQEREELLARAEAEGRIPSKRLRMKAARDELETMYRVAAEKSGKRRGKIIVP